VHDQEKARQPQASRPRSSWLESLIDERPPRGHGSTFEGAQTIGHDAQHSRVAEIAFDQPRIIHCPDQETEAAPYALKLAQLKAVAVAAHQPRSLVIGCDSVLELDGRILGKPRTAAEATRRWQDMRGRAGALHTGHCVIDTHREVWLGRSAATQVRFAHVADEEIEAYVGSGEPLQVAGAFTIDGLGSAYVSGVSGDPHNVVGISVPLLRLMFDELGFVWHEFWAPRPGAG